MDSFALYILTFILLSVSFFKDKHKTKKALLKSVRAFEKILPELLSVLLLIGFLLSVIHPETISILFGKHSGATGMFVASVLGAITLIPGFVAFPLASILLEQGAGYMQIGVFISTLMMVGIMTLPLEIKYFGKKFSLLRNAFAFIFSFIVAFIIGLVVV